MRAVKRPIWSAMAKNRLRSGTLTCQSGPHKLPRIADHELFLNQTFTHLLRTLFQENNEWADRARSEKRIMSNRKLSNILFRSGQIRRRCASLHYANWMVPRVKVIPYISLNSSVMMHVCVFILFSHCQNLFCREHHRCLDIGCNNGTFTAQIANKFKCRYMLGIDSDIRLIEAAWKAHQNNICCFLRENFVLEYHNGSKYDTISAFSVVKWIHLNYGDDILVSFFQKVWPTRIEFIVLMFYLISFFCI